MLHSPALARRNSVTYPLRRWLLDLWRHPSPLRLERTLITKKYGLGWIARQPRGETRSLIRGIIHKELCSGLGRRSEREGSSFSSSSPESSGSSRARLVRHRDRTPSRSHCSRSSSRSSHHSHASSHSSHVVGGSSCLPPPPVLTHQSPFCAAYTCVSGRLSLRWLLPKTPRVFAHEGGKAKKS